ncbi:hypothetical protein BsWGS_09143 [Bradybaena similaris]
MKTSADVVVIGAGISGLTAARSLKQSGLEVLVLEARDRVGGRMYTIENKMSKYLDLGASYVAPNFHRLLKLVKEFGLETFYTNEKEDTVLFERGKSKRFRSLFPPAGGLISWLDMNNIIRLFYKFGSQIPLDAPWDAPRAKEWDQMTVQDFMDKYAWTKAGRDIVEHSVRINNTIDPHEVSLLYVLWHYQTTGGLHMITAVEGGAQEMRIVGGTQQICNRLAASLGEENVLLQQVVQQIDQTGSDVIITTSSGAQIKCKHVILTVPLTVQSQIAYSPPLPLSRSQLLQRVPMGCVMKAFVYYDKPFWKEAGYCGSSYIIDSDSLICYTLDNCPPDGSCYCLVAFIAADNARRAAEMSEADRKYHVTEVLAKVFQSKKALKPIFYEEKNWSGEPFSGGCYFVSMAPGVLSTVGRTIREPVGRIFFAGTETATVWVGYMEGAIQSGTRAAKEVLFSRGLITKQQLQEDADDSQDQAELSDRLKMSFLERNAPGVQGFLGLLALAGAGASAGVAAYSKL